MKHTFLYLLTAFAAACLLAAGCSKSDPAEKPGGNPGGDSGQVEQPAREPGLKDIVMYEANERIFARRGDNNALKAIEQRLPQIAGLGVNVLWLMPVNEFGSEKSIGSPYCIRNYTAVAPEYGTLDDLKALVSAAHARNMYVILDWVANHTAWDHAWITEHPDWYVQSGGSIASPPGWNDVAQLNYGNAALREAMIEAMKFWIREADIDGYRCDYADSPQIRNAGFWKTAIDALRAAFPAKKLLMLAEGTERSNLAAGFDMDYAWNYYDAVKDAFNPRSGKSATTIIQRFNAQMEGVAADKSRLFYTTNHDQASENGTPVYTCGGRDGALAAFAITTLLGGSTLIYSGQETPANLRSLSFFTYDHAPWNWDEDPAFTAAMQQLVAIRQSNDAFVTGRLQSYDDPDIVLFHRLDSSRNREAIVAVNIRDEARSISLPGSLRSRTMTNALTGTEEALPATIELAPYAYRIWTK